MASCNSMASCNLIKIVLVLLALGGCIFQVLGSSPINQIKARNTEGKHVYATYNYKAPNIHGVTSIMNVWNPSTEEEDMSLAQMWIIHDAKSSQSSNEYESIEVGWQVYPNKYKNHIPIFFIFYTNDNYGRTRCYNMECDGFVPIDTEKYSPGKPIIGYAKKFERSKKDINITVIQNMGTKNWELYADGSHMGYWKASLFRGLTRVGATDVWWGGEVAWSPKYFREGSKQPPTSSTKMGSGGIWLAEPSQREGRVAHFKNLGYMDAQLNKISPDPTKVTHRVDYPEYYNLSRPLQKDKDGNAFFHYGGPGPKK